MGNGGVLCVCGEEGECKKGEGGSRRGEVAVGGQEKEKEWNGSLQMTLIASVVKKKGGKMKKAEEPPASPTSPFSSRSKAYVDPAQGTNKSANRPGT